MKMNKLVQDARLLRAKIEKLKAAFDTMAAELREHATTLRLPGQSTVDIGGGAKVQWTQVFSPLSPETVQRLSSELREKLTEDARVIKIRKGVDPYRFTSVLEAAGENPAEWLDISDIVSLRRGADEKVAWLASRQPDDLHIAAASALVELSRKTPRLLLGADQ